MCYQSLRSNKIRKAFFRLHLENNKCRTRTGLCKTDSDDGRHPISLQMVGKWRYFTAVTKLIKKINSLYGLRGRCLNITDVCMDFEPCCLKVYNLVSVHPKKHNLNTIFYVAVSILSIGYNLKLATVPCAILEWPIANMFIFLSLFTSLSLKILTRPEDSILIS